MYRDSSGWSRLGAGTSGYFLKTQGASSNPLWASPDMNLISTTTFSAAANSGDITIEEDKLYLVLFEFQKDTLGDIVELRFNSDAGASSYGWGYHGMDISNPGVAEVSGGDSVDDSIQLGPSIGASTQSFLKFYLSTKNRIANDQVYLHGTRNILASFYNLFGIYVLSGTLSSFEFFTATGAMSGVVYLYEYALTP